MKRLSVIAATTLAAFAMSYQAQASVTMSFAVGDLYDQTATLLTGGIAVVVSDNSGLGLANLQNGLTPTSPLTAGSSINGDLVLGTSPYDITASSGQGGYFGGTVATQAFQAGAPKVFVLFFPTLPDSATVAGYSTWYGVVYNGNASDLQGGAAWAMPADGQSVTLNAWDTTEGGAVAPGSYGMQAAYETIPVPEPSSIALVVLGLFGAVGIIRRRS